MRVAIDGRRLQDQPYGGVGRILANVLPFLAEELDLVVLTDARRPAPGIPWRQVALSPGPKLPETAWLQVSVAAWLRHFDGVFHGTFNALPVFTRCPSVVTIHDLSYEIHPEDFHWPKRQVWRAQARWAARHAQIVLTDSLFSRGALVEHYAVEPDRIVVAAPAVDPVFLGTPDIVGVRDRFSLNGPFIVALGGARRRALEVAIGAWRFARSHGVDCQLVVVGPEAPSPEPGLVHAGRVDDRTWAGLLAASEALCYPTRFEGFGLPALEAAAAGAPVVCARVGPLPEVLGDAAAWCEHATAEEIGAGLVRVLSDAAYRGTLVAAGRARAHAMPTWGDAARGFLRAYERAAAA